MINKLRLKECNDSAKFINVKDAKEYTNLILLWLQDKENKDKVFLSYFYIEDGADRICSSFLITADTKELIDDAKETFNKALELSDDKETYSIIEFNSFNEIFKQPELI